MTIDEIVIYTTNKLGMTDTTARTMAGSFLDARHSMIWNAANWKQARYQETVAVAAGTQDVTLQTACDFVTACRWADVYELLPMSDGSALALNPAGYDVSGPVLGFVPLGKPDGIHVQIRLMQKPTEAKNLLVIGKAKVTAYTTGQTPCIPGEEQALCDFIMGDLYEWLRQFGKAQYYHDRAQKLLDQMIEIETAQAAEIRRIVPMVQQLESAWGGDSLNPLG